MKPRKFIHLRYWTAKKKKKMYNGNMIKQVFSFKEKVMLERRRHLTSMGKRALFGETEGALG